MVETICLKHWHFCQIIRPSLGTSHRTYICHSMFHIKKKKEQLNIWREKSALALVDSSDSSPWGLLWPHLVVATHAIFTVSNGQKEKWKTLWENITGNSCSRCGPHGTSGGQVVVLVAVPTHPIFINLLTPPDHPHFLCFSIKVYSKLVTIFVNLFKNLSSNLVSWVACPVYSIMIFNSRLKVICANDTLFNCARAY